MRAHWPQVAILTATAARFLGFTAALDELACETRNNHNSSEYSGADLAGLRHTMKIPSDQPEVFQKFKPEVMEIDGGTTNNVASLVHHISGTIRNDPFNHVNITKLHRCSSNACSKKEVEAQRQGLVSARLPAAFWKIFRIKNNLDGGKEGNWELQLGSFSFFSRSLNVAFLPFTDMIMGDCLVRDVEKAGEYMLGRVLCLTAGEAFVPVRLCA
ncbi:hypothetical protein GX50_02620 [[Emmonsia] crescens]|uniref:Uncharacterized protein n=1 Tax=[Emmonsia] crescens TaxID=73230 RepID=A0A2B7ZP28_9EURO|nr:hypothetical protein GX50_02620 [Emmonsia crescens]